MIKSLCNYILVEGKDFNPFPKYIEVSEHRYQVLEEAGFSFTTKKIHNILIIELSNCG